MGQPQHYDKEKMESSSSPSSSLLQRLQQVDLLLSIPVFQLSFPKPIEFLFSLPGNLMGPPSLQIVAPLWLVVLSSLEEDPKTPKTTTTLMVALVLSTCLLLIPFVVFLKTNNMRMISHVLYPNLSFAISPLIGTAIIYRNYDYYNNNNNNATTTPSPASLGYHGIVLYCLCCAIILFLKHETKRLRPCVTHGQQYIPRKNFQIIPIMLSKHASFTSFPSGDVMGATSWAIPLWYLNYPKSSCFLIGLTAFGRMFFLAHHLGDTIGGFGVCFIVHWLLQVFGGSSSSSSQDIPPMFLLPKIGPDQWYHPMLALGTLVFASRFRKSDHK